MFGLHCHATWSYPIIFHSPVSCWSYPGYSEGITVSPNIYSTSRRSDIVKEPAQVGEWTTVGWHREGMGLAGGWGNDVCARNWGRMTYGNYFAAASSPTPPPPPPPSSSSSPSPPQIPDPRSQLTCFRVYNWASLCVYESYDEALTWTAPQHIPTFHGHMAVCQNLVPLVNIKIAGKWMFIPLKMVLIGIDPYPYGGFLSGSSSYQPVSAPSMTVMTWTTSKVPRTSWNCVMATLARWHPFPWERKPKFHPENGNNME